MTEFQFFSVSQFCTELASYKKTGQPRCQDERDGETDPRGENWKF